MVELPCRARQQLQEPKQVLTQIRDETAAASPPAASQETESALPAEPQEEASTTPLIPAAAQEDRPSMATPVAADHQAQASTDNVTLAVHEDQVASPFPQSPLSHTSTPHLDPDDEGDAGDPSGCPGNPGHEVNYETRGDSQPSQGPRDMSEDDPGMSILANVTCFGVKGPLSSSGSYPCTMGQGHVPLERVAPSSSNPSKQGQPQLPRDAGAGKVLPRGAQGFSGR
ncbi:uncharacterized protein [Heliangelus exortis]|uniref:uncharacterized protein n=1 Tax=Heliangelus exortis TaxID=472823 RepID=UPI003A8EAC8B